MAKSSTHEFRETYRNTIIGKKYNGKLHFWGITLFCIVVVSFAVSRIQSPNWKEILVIPVSFILVNAAEYFGHKGPMHHLNKRLAVVFKRHTLQHHEFFTYDDMYFDSQNDAKAVLFPPILLLFFFFFFAVPCWLLFYLFWSANAGYFFIATVFVYYLNYEWLHYTYHLPPEHYISKLPFIKILRRLHHVHHEKTLMTKYNFNITYPIFDWLLGTYKKNIQ